MREVFEDDHWSEVSEHLKWFLIDSTKFQMQAAYARSLEWEIARKGHVWSDEELAALIDARWDGYFAADELVERCEEFGGLVVPKLRLCKVNKLNGSVVPHSWCEVAAQFPNMGQMIAMPPFSSIHANEARRLFMLQQQLGWRPSSTVQ